MTDIFKGLSDKVVAHIKLMAEEQMKVGGKYDPRASSNFWEAMSEAKQADLDRVAELLKANEHVAVSAALNLIAYNYWFEYACVINTEEAIDQVAMEEFDSRN